jgi:hypothetical protein
LFFVGCLLLSFGFLGFFKQYGSQSALAAAVLGIVFSVLFILLTFIGLGSGGYYYGYHWIGIEVWFAHILVGITFIIMGISILLNGKHTGLRGIGIITGIMYIVSGGMLIGFLGFFAVAWFTLIVSAIMSAIVFLKAPQYSQMPAGPHYRYPQQPQYYNYPPSRV